MATFRQVSTIHEDGYGEVTVLIVLSNTVAGLYATEGTKETNVFLIGSSKKDLEVSAGTQAQDELSITVDAASVATENDAEALAYFRDAQDSSLNRFIAVYINTAELPDPPDPDDCEFFGRIDPELKARDIKLQGDEWGTDWNPDREWDANASTFMDISFDDIKLKDLIYGNEELNVTGIDEDWEDDNVSDRLSYFRSDNDDFIESLFGLREAKQEGLVNLSALLRKLADNFEQTLLDQGIGTFSVVIDDIELDMKFSPARFSVQDGWDRTLNVFRKNRLLFEYKVKADDAVSCFLGDSHATTDDSIFVSYRLAKPGDKGESEFTYDKFETFTDLLYGVAESLNLYVRFDVTESSTLHVSWISRQSIEDAPQIYIRDTTSGSLDLSVSPKEDRERHIGLATKYSMDGPDEFWMDSQTPRGSSKRHQSESGKGLHPPLTTGVTLLNLSDRFDERPNFIVTQDFIGQIPHNTKFYTDGSPSDLGLQSFDVSSLIYVCVEQNGEYINDTAEKIFLPVRKVHATVEGSDRTFDCLSEYVNEQNARAEGFFSASYEVEVPFLMGFSENSDGSSPSWKALRLGRRTTIEEEGVPREFIVVGIERNYQAVTTKVKLHRASRFAFTPASGLDEDEVVTIGGGFTPGTSTHGVRGTIIHECIADGDIAMGDAVLVLNQDDAGLVHVRRATSTEKDCGFTIGLALSSALDGDAVEIQTSNRFECIDYSFVAGLPVYVRTSTLPAHNLSQDLLTARTSTEDAVITVGLADSSSSVVIGLVKQRVFLHEECACCG